MPGGVLDYDEDEPDVSGMGGRVIKDWSDDDTEPGDDDAFSPVIHRIINSSGDDDDGDIPDDDY